MSESPDKLRNEGGSQRNVPDDYPRDALHSTIVQVLMYCVELRPYQIS